MSVVWIVHVQVERFFYAIDVILITLDSRVVLITIKKCSNKHLVKVN